MKFFGDHDGKSKTSSAVDSAHYPEMNGREDEFSAALNHPSYEEIAAMAYQLWEEGGYAADSAERNWLEAERRLLASRETPVQSKVLVAQAGSVQR